MSFIEMPPSEASNLLSAHLAANFREFQNHLLRAGSTSVGPCFPQDFSRFSAQRRVMVAPQGTIGIYTARTALLATTWDRSAVSAFGRHQGVSYPQALGNKGLGTGTASDQQVRPTPMQVGTTAARPVPPRSCGENRCVDTDGLERWFRLPKGHGRRIHGHRHAGVRIVQEGPTLVHALDAHLTHPEPFGVTDLLPYRSARPPECQRQAIHRRKIMRRARSKTKRPKLLAELERRYQ